MRLRQEHLLSTRLSKQANKQNHDTGIHIPQPGPMHILGLVAAKEIKLSAAQSCLL